MSENFAELAPTAESLVLILKKLRSPEGCPWDREQTAESLSRCLTGEVAELIDAIDNADAENIAEELGDVLMNLVFQAVVAEEQGLFDWASVVRAINAKMIRRHPHVFGEASAADSAEVFELWQKIKAGEKAARGEVVASILDKVPRSLSALDRAAEIQKKVSKVGFDWSSAEDILNKVQEELDEVREAIQEKDEAHIDEEIGDLLFAAANLPRFRKGKSAEELLRMANRKFTRRFQYIEQALRDRGVPLESAGIEVLEALWQEAKSHE